MAVWLNGKEVIDAGVVNSTDYIASGTGTPGVIDKIGGDLYITDDLEVDGYVHFGSGTTSHALGANGDLFVSTKIEVDGFAYFDSGMQVLGTLQTYDNNGIYFGNSSDGRLVFSGQQAANAMLMAVDNVSHNLVITKTANSAKDHDHAGQSNPTVFLHSAVDPDSDNTQWISFAHNQTDSREGVGKGNKITFHSAPTSLADDASFTLPDASTGFGFFMIGDNQEYAQIAWDASANVTLIANSANVATADTDTNLCFIDGGTQVSVKNRLGSELEIMFDYHYTT